MKRSEKVCKHNVTETTAGEVVSIRKVIKRSWRNLFRPQSVMKVKIETPLGTFDREYNGRPLNVGQKYFVDIIREGHKTGLTIYPELKEYVTPECTLTIESLLNQ